MIVLQACEVPVASREVSMISSCDKTAIYERSGALDFSSKSFQ